jgi:hypothetical protein
VAKSRVLVAEVRRFTCRCNLPNCTLHDGRRGYGVAAGGKWHAYLFSDPAMAGRFVDELGGDQKAIRANVGYPAPFAWALGDRP